jgi:hypothetical protein
MLSHRIEREMEYLAKTTLPLNSIGIIHFAGIPPSLHIGIIFHSYIVCQREREFTKGLIFHSKYSFLVINAKGGESISPKQKEHTNFKIFRNKFKFLNIFSIGIFEISIPLRNSISIGKTLLNTKRRISLRGSFV